MPLRTEDYEKLGVFYLGRPVDPETGEKSGEPMLYDSPDLTTHAVVVGMTGSGKTGLGIALLEEAALDGIPAIIIDPKGDLTNLALQFPDLRPDDFHPWVSPEEAARAGQSVGDFAAAQAAAWSGGLAKWGQDGSRIRRLQESAEVAVFTPGSTAGRPVALVRSFAPPPAAILEDAELLSGHIETTVASLLGLLGVGGDSERGREATLLGLILREAWGRGESLELADLARRIQKPPFSQVGVLDVESFYPEKDRFQLLLALNNLLASPGFEVWRQGVPLEVQDLLYTPSGKPRLAVFSIAHLGDAERMFFVSMLLGATVAWMRRQSGTPSLRALLYMDEVFGYLPPTANPPSKKPLMVLLKQARAFGLGIIVATQNPADLDYKALSNAGTWFIGRLQAERDKMRLLDGLSGMGLDRARIDRLLSGLGKRVFLMNNVHESQPVVFESRWCLSYLCGPLTREQIRQLPGTRAGSAELATPAAETPAPAVAGLAAAPPLADKVLQVYARGGAAGGSWRPVLAAALTVRHREAKLKVDATRDLVLVADFPAELQSVDWAGAEELDEADFTDVVPKEGRWEAVPEAGLRAKSYEAWKAGLSAWLAGGAVLRVWQCGASGEVSQPGESERDFRVRLGQVLREQRDARIALLRDKTAKAAAALSTKMAAAQEALRREEAQAGQAKMQTLVSIGTSLLGAFLGRKALGAATVTRAGTAVRGVGRSVKESGDVAAVQAKIDRLTAEQQALEEQLQEEIDALTASLDPLTSELVERAVPVSRSGTRIKWIALGWMPA